MVDYERMVDEAMKFLRGSEWRKWDLHIHTSSSYDAYKGSDADAVLVQALRDNDISVAAITDHFIIDSGKILCLRQLAPEITFLPGVELRTDKGAPNIHVTLIFSEEVSLANLSEDFNSFRRNKAKNPGDNDKIYWDFEEIIRFSDDHNGISIIHAGSKDKGVDDKISNALPVSEAIKEEIASKINMFEMGKLKDLSEYKKFVFPHIGIKPMIICSDNHDPRSYASKENLWIKADPNFNGLIQCIYHPEERVYVGSIPPKLDKVNKNKRTYIESVTIKKSNTAKNTMENWFNSSIPLNSGLTVIIGNKGSGKSALTDIIGHFGNSKSMEDASFLNNQRFRKLPKRLADDYVGNITWLDGQNDEQKSLGLAIRPSTIETVQYLPQRFIEKVCNELGDEFQSEINNVIFSYVDLTEKGDARNLEGLIYNKSASIFGKEDELRSELTSINQLIIMSEDRLIKTYLNTLEDNLVKRSSDLEREIRNKPKEVSKPESSPDDENIRKISEISSAIRDLEDRIGVETEKVTEYNKRINQLNYLKERINSVVAYIQECNAILESNALEYGLNIETLKIQFSTPLQEVDEKIHEILTLKDSVVPLIDSTDNADANTSLYKQLHRLVEEKDNIISLTSNKEKAYQKYLSDLKEWEKTTNEIIGSEVKEGSIEFIRKEINYVKDILPSEYEKLKEARLKKIGELFALKQEKAKVYSSVYEPIEKKLNEILQNMDDKIQFAVNIAVSDRDIGSKLLNYISKSFSGTFSGTTDAANKMSEIISSCDFNKVEDVLKFINSVLESVYENVEISSKKIRNKVEFYELLSSLSYLDVEYNLTMNGRGLKQLSAGQRGIVLLMFYLALSKNEIPLLIDQPEDNLDNQSVYGNLVPCIIEAKKKRQIIIVTHNPNIAIACDSEQIIYCSIDKHTNEISYEMGSIEDKDIKERVVEVLEGTRPAFRLRSFKYMINPGLT